MTDKTCQHTNAGCNYPEGECSGICKSYKQPKALYLADVLSAGFECDMEWYEIESANELRRLHAENEALKVRLLKATKSALDHKERGDMLLDALELFPGFTDDATIGDSWLWKVGSTIAKTGGAA